MAYQFKNIADYEIGIVNFAVADTTVLKQYKIVYASNVETYSDTYRIAYISTNTSEMTDTYGIYYSSIFGDSAQTYRIRYFSGREPASIVDRYYVRYSSTYTDSLYTTYSLRYTTTGASTEPQRVRYKIKYTSQTAGDHTQTYKIRFSTSTFYDNYAKYTIKFGSTGAEEILLRAVLLRDNDRTDAMFEIRGILDKSLEDYLFVISNMPKYQTLEYKVGESLPYLDYITPDEVAELDIFDNDGITSYTVKGYILLKDVEDLNGLSIDVYDYNNDYKKINRSKTYFFGLESTDYIESLISLKGSIYYFINRSSNYYNVKYLNYISASITPTFRFGIDCCFSRKINKTNYSYCSPF